MPRRIGNIDRKRMTSGGTTEPLARSVPISTIVVPTGSKVQVANSWILRDTSNAALKLPRQSASAARSKIRRRTTTAARKRVRYGTRVVADVSPVGHRGVKKNE